MRSSVFLALTLLSLKCAIAAPIGPPTEEDLGLLMNDITRQMRDPDSVKLVDVVAVRDPTSSITSWVCGEVRGKNGFGGYADPAQFVALLADDPLSGKRMLQLLKIAEDRHQAGIVRDLCQRKADLALAADQAAEPVREDLLGHGRLVFACRAEGEASPSCGELRQVSERLRVAGFCLDNPGGWKLC